MHAHNTHTHAHTHTQTHTDSASQGVDECLDNNGDCTDVCVNTPYSHFCTCRQGHYLDPNDRHVCMGELYTRLGHVHATTLTLSSAHISECTVRRVSELQRQ